MSANDYYAAIHYYCVRGHFADGLVVARRGAEKTGALLCKFWAAYCLVKTGSADRAQEVFGSAKDADGRRLWARLRAAAGQPAAPEEDAHLSESTRAALCLLALYEGAAREMNEHARKAGVGALARFARAAAALRDFEQNPDAASKAEGLSELAALFDELLAADADSPLSRLLRLSLLLHQRRSAEARRCAEQWQCGDAAAECLQRAELAFVARDWPALAAEADRVHTVAPRSALACSYRLLAAICPNRDAALVEQRFGELLGATADGYGASPAGADIIIAAANLLLRSGELTAGLGELALAELERRGAAGFPALLLAAEVRMQRGEWERAARGLREAAKQGPGRAEPFAKLVEVALLKGDWEEAEAHLDFLKEVFGALEGERGEFLLYEAVLRAGKPGRPPAPAELAAARDRFEAGVIAQLGRGESAPPDIRQLEALAPDLFLTLARVSLGEQLASGAPARTLPPLCAQFAHALTAVVGHFPAFNAFRLCLARCHALGGEAARAERAAASVLELTPTHAAAHTLLLRLALHRGDATAALRAADDATANNFELMSDAEFLLLRGRADAAAGDPAAALRRLTKARQLLGDAPDALAAEVDAELAACLAKTGDIAAARETIMRAAAVHSETPRADLLMLAYADVLLEARDPPKALEVLRNIEAGSAYFAAARRKMAQVYRDTLKQLPRATQCLRELHALECSAESALELAAALTATHEFDDALRVLGDARAGPTALLAAECLLGLGRFSEAEALLRGADARNPSVALALVELCNRLGRYGDALAVDCEEVVARGDDADAGLQIALALAFAARKCGRAPVALACLSAAAARSPAGSKPLLLRVLAEKARAEAAASPDAALRTADRGLALDLDNKPLLLLKAELALAQEQPESARECCRQVLKGDPHCLPALRLLGDALLCAGQLDAAARGFWKVLQRQLRESAAPGALPPLAFIFRHLGAFPAFAATFEQLRLQVPNPGIAAIALTAGLEGYFTRRFPAAVAQLAAARLDPQYHDLATLLLVDVYLHDDSALLYSHFFHEDKLKRHGEERLRAVGQLVAALTPAYAAEARVLAAALGLLRAAGGAEPELAALEELAGQPAFARLRSMVLYFLAVGYLRAKNAEKVKEKMVAARELRFCPRSGWDEYYFRAQLLCVDALLAKERLAPAKCILDTLFSCCRMCLPACDYLALYHEKSGAGLVEPLAAAHALTSRRDPNIGLRLARQLLSAGRNLECYHVCKQVLRAHPDLAEVQGEVLPAARAGLLNSY